MPLLPWFKGSTSTPEYGGGDNALVKLGNTRLEASERGHDARGLQSEATNMYRDAALGRGTSVAEQQMQRGLAQNISAQQGLAAQSRGGNLASMERNAATAGASAMNQSNLDTGMLRAGEIDAARSGMAGMANTQASQALQEQLAYEQALQNAYGQQLGANVQWGLGQRAMDIQQREGNRKFGTEVVNSLAKVIDGIIPL